MFCCHGHMCIETPYYTYTYIYVYIYIIYIQYIYIYRFPVSEVQKFYTLVYTELSKANDFTAVGKYIKVMPCKWARVRADMPRKKDQFQCSSQYDIRKVLTLPTDPKVVQLAIPRITWYIANTLLLSGDALTQTRTHRNPSLISCSSKSSKNVKSHSPQRANSVVSVVAQIIISLAIQFARHYRQAPSNFHRSYCIINPSCITMRHFTCRIFVQFIMYIQLHRTRILKKDLFCDQHSRSVHKKIK